MRSLCVFCLVEVVVCVGGWCTFGLLVLIGRGLRHKVAETVVAGARVVA